MDLCSPSSQRCSDGEESEDRVSPSPGTIVNNKESAEESEEPIDSPIVRKKRVKQFSDSDSDSQSEVINVPVYKDAQHTPDKSNNSDTDDDLINDKNNSKKLSYQSRLRLVCSDSDSKDEDEEISSKHEESRISNKRNKLRDKFKNLHSSRLKESTHKKSTDTNENSDKSEKSDEDISSIGKIKQIIQEKTHLKSTLYDPDTSDEESPAPKLIIKQKNARKTTKLTSPKPIRMSAKQAMENMQKIKSESNRMLREKDVSLPYHRPKALSLKDIMSRRRPAVSSDGKILPIKMNEEQLRQYALQLEQRQKEMMELCKSDSEDEANENEVHENKEEANENQVHENKGDTNENDEHENENKANENEVNEGTEKNDDTSLVNDSMYDDLVKDNESIINEVTPCSITHDNHIETSVGLTDVCDDNNDANLIIETDKIEDPESALSLSFNKESLKEQGNTVNDNLLNTEQKNTEEDVSAEMELMYNDSVEDNNINETEHTTNANNNCEKIEDLTKEGVKLCTEKGSQINYDTETSTTEPILNKTDSIDCDVRDKLSTNSIEISNEDKSDDFPDDDLNMDDIDNLIENAEILSQNEINKLNSPMLIRDAQNLKTKPKLTGAPGMVIDLDGTDPLIPKKLSGVELLKERFTFFAKLKTPEEKAKENERRIKPGLQHLKLKHELEEKIAEQRSLEWAKRLEEERQHHQEMDIIRGDGSDVEDDIDKIEAKLADNDQDREEKEHSTESEEEEEEEDDINLKEKPRIKNPMIADEAEESDCDDEDESEQNGIDGNEANISDQEDDKDDADDEEDDNESEKDSSEAESEEENQSKPKKGRILKAFEDSDDEDTPANKVSEENNDVTVDNHIVGKEDVSPPIKYTQDDELQLAQRDKSCSEDLFASQESANLVNSVQTLSDDLGTQTFSILNNDTAESSINDMPVPNSLDLKEVGDTQSYEGEDLDHVVGMCSGSFSQNLVTSQFPSTQPTQDLGEDVLALCTGKFYDNQFVSQIDSESKNSGSQDINDLTAIKDTNIADTDKGEGNNADFKTKDSPLELDMDNQRKCDKNVHDPKPKDNNLLNTILDELNDPEFETQKPKKYFGDDGANNKENNLDSANTQQKKRQIIDSDDEVNDVDNGDRKLKKKFKKKKMENRALQISDDEEEQDDEDNNEMSEIEDGDEERIVEYDSEENEVVVQPDKSENRKKKRKATEFFEQEAELTSEDEWVGSGDEDEAGLDRLEREAGDDDTFNQRQLQRELGQIHMRDVLDQDKREVRLIQELLFEDGDLGGGGRQRKFKWKNADGEEEGGSSYHEFDTQEDEFESEEQWRKQRHEREMFIKQLKESGKDDLNTSVDSSSLMKTELSETNISIKQGVEIETQASEPEKKTAKDIPSPKKSFVLFQQNYHSSLLTRGRGALARLASLAIPLAADDDTPKPGSLAPSSKRNFVFAAVTPKQEKPKVSKRKAETNVGTPKLVKKMKIEDNKNHPKNSLMDFLKT